MDTLSNWMKENGYEKVELESFVPSDEISSFLVETATLRILIFEYFSIFLKVIAI